MVANKNVGPRRNCEHPSRDRHNDLRRSDGALLAIAAFKEEKTAWMFIAGNILLLLGATVDMWLPINKSIWTSSYAIFMAGWALVCFATFYWFVDVKGYSRWAKPFIIFGMNAITVYVLRSQSERSAIL